MKTCLCLIVLAALAGCAATPADFTEQEAAQAARVRAYPASAFAPPHTVIAPISSRTCDAGSLRRYANTQGEALWLLKLETARRGGNAVVGYACDVRAVDPLSRCLQSKRCQGKAARLD